jgi:hypothetical protein
VSDQIYSRLSEQGKGLYNKVVAIFGANNVTFTSGKRNRKGASQHNSGDAIDFLVKDKSIFDTQAIIDGSGIAYGQSIAEKGGGKSSGDHNHLSVGTKKENLYYPGYGDNYYAQPINKSIWDRYKNFINKNVTEPINENITNPINDFINAPVTSGISFLVGSSITKYVYIAIGVLLVALSIGSLLFNNEIRKILK